MPDKFSFCIVSCTVHFTTRIIRLGLFTWPRYKFLSTGCIRKWSVTLPLMKHKHDKYKCRLLLRWQQMTTDDVVSIDVSNAHWMFSVHCKCICPLTIQGLCCYITVGKKATIYQVTTMLATATNVLFPGPNHLITTGADDPSL